MEKILVFSFYT